MDDWLRLDFEDEMQDEDNDMLLNDMLLKGEPGLFCEVPGRKGEQLNNNNVRRFTWLLEELCGKQDLISRKTVLPFTINSEESFKDICKKMTDTFFRLNGLNINELTTVINKIALLTNNRKSFIVMINHGSEESSIMSIGTKFFSHRYAIIKAIMDYRMAVHTEYRDEDIEHIKKKMNDSFNISSVSHNVFANEIKDCVKNIKKDTKKLGLWSTFSSMDKHKNPTRLMHEVFVHCATCLVIIMADFINPCKMVKDEMEFVKLDERYKDIIYVKEKVELGSGRYHDFVDYTMRAIMDIVMEMGPMPLEYYQVDHISKRMMCTLMEANLREDAVKLSLCKEIFIHALSTENLTNNVLSFEKATTLSGEQYIAKLVENYRIRMESLIGSRARAIDKMEYVMFDEGLVRKTGPVNFSETAKKIYDEYNKNKKSKENILLTSSIIKMAKIQAKRDEKELKFNEIKIEDTVMEKLRKKEITPGEAQSSVQRGALNVKSTLQRAYKRVKYMKDGHAQLHKVSERFKQLMQMRRGDDRADSDRRLPNCFKAVTLFLTTIATRTNSSHNLINHTERIHEEINDFLMNWENYWRQLYRVWVQQDKIDMARKAERKKRLEFVYLANDHITTVLSLFRVTSRSWDLREIIYEVIKDMRLIVQTCLIAVYANGYNINCWREDIIKYFEIYQPTLLSLVAPDELRSMEESKDWAWKILENVLFPPEVQIAYAMQTDRVNFAKEVYLTNTATIMKQIDKVKDALSQGELEEYYKDEPLECFMLSIPVAKEKFTIIQLLRQVIDLPNFYMNILNSVTMFDDAVFFKTEDEDMHGTIFDLEEVGSECEIDENKIMDPDRDLAVDYRYTGEKIVKTKLSRNERRIHVSGKEKYEHIKKMRAESHSSVVNNRNMRQLTKIYCSFEMDFRILNKIKQNKDSVSNSWFVKYKPSVIEMILNGKKQEEVFEYYISTLDNDNLVIQHIMKSGGKEELMDQVEKSCLERKCKELKFDVETAMTNDVIKLYVATSKMPDNLSIDKIYNTLIKEGINMESLKNFCLLSICYNSHRVGIADMLQFVVNNISNKADTQPFLTLLKRRDLPYLHRDVMQMVTVTMVVDSLCEFVINILRVKKMNSLVIAQIYNTEIVKEVARQEKKCHGATLKILQKEEQMEIVADLQHVDMLLGNCPSIKIFKNRDDEMACIYNICGSNIDKLMQLNNVIEKLTIKKLSVVGEAIIKAMGDKVMTRKNIVSAASLSQINRAENIATITKTTKHRNVVDDLLRKHGESDLIVMDDQVVRVLREICKENKQVKTAVYDYIRSMMKNVKAKEETTAYSSILKTEIKIQDLMACGDIIIFDMANLYKSGMVKSDQITSLLKVMQTVGFSVVVLEGKEKFKLPEGVTSVNEEQGENTLKGYDDLIMFDYCIQQNAWIFTNDTFKELEDIMYVCNNCDFHTLRKEYCPFCKGRDLRGVEYQFQKMKLNKYTETRNKTEVIVECRLNKDVSTIKFSVNNNKLDERTYKYKLKIGEVDIYYIQPEGEETILLFDTVYTHTPILNNFVYNTKNVLNMIENISGKEIKTLLKDMRENSLEQLVSGNENVEPVLYTNDLKLEKIIDAKSYTNKIKRQHNVHMTRKAVYRETYVSTTKLISKYGLIVHLTSDKEIILYRIDQTEVNQILNKEMMRGGMLPAPDYEAEMITANYMKVTLDLPYLTMRASNIINKVGISHRTYEELSKMKRCPIAKINLHELKWNRDITKLIKNQSKETCFAFKLKEMDSKNLNKTKYVYKDEKFVLIKNNERIQNEESQCFSKYIGKFIKRVLSEWKVNFVAYWLKGHIDNLKRLNENYCNLVDLSGAVQNYGKEGVYRATIDICYAFIEIYVVITDDYKFMAWEIVPTEEAIYILTSMYNVREGERKVDIEFNMNFWEPMIAWTECNPKIYKDEHDMWTNLIHSAFAMYAAPGDNKGELMTKWYTFQTGLFMPTINEAYFIPPIEGLSCKINNTTIKHALMAGYDAKPRSITHTDYVKNIYKFLKSKFSVNNAETLRDVYAQLNAWNKKSDMRQDLFSLSKCDDTNLFVSVKDKEIDQFDYLNIKYVKGANETIMAKYKSGAGRAFTFSNKTLVIRREVPDSSREEHDEEKCTKIFKEYINDRKQTSNIQYVKAAIDRIQVIDRTTLQYEYSVSCLQMQESSKEYESHGFMTNIYFKEGGEHVLRIRFGNHTNRVERQIDEGEFEVQEEIRLNEVSIENIAKIITERINNERTLVLYTDDILPSIMQREIQTAKYDITHLTGCLYVVDNLMFKKLQSIISIDEIINTEPDVGVMGKKDKRSRKMDANKKGSKNDIFIVQIIITVITFVVLIMFKMTKTIVCLMLMLAQYTFLSEKTTNPDEDDA